MNILLLATLYNPNYEQEYVEKSTTGSGNAINTYMLNLIDGLVNRSDVHMEIVSVPAIARYPQFKDLIIKKEQWSYKGIVCHQLGFVNLLAAKQPVCRLLARSIVKKWVAQHSADSCIIVYPTFEPFLSAVKNVKKQIKVINVVTDLPEFYDINSKVNLVRRILRKVNNAIIYKAMNRTDGFVFLADAMAQRLGVKKPNVIVEGIAKPIPYRMGVQSGEQKIILYTGTLSYKYNIITMLDAFERIQDKSYQLWICGGGEAEKEVRARQEKNRRIHFWGLVSKQKIYELQLQATILINPRQDTAEYTRYSFPSKIVEYIASGIPVLMYKLAGIASEYDNYVYYIHDNSVEALADAIVKIAGKSAAELYEFGDKARKWLLDNKNSNVQAQKVIEMIKNEI